MMPPWHVQENKWRAARYGLDAEVITHAAALAFYAALALAPLLLLLLLFEPAAALAAGIAAALASADP